MFNLSLLILLLIPENQSLPFEMSYCLGFDEEDITYGY